MAQEMLRIAQEITAKKKPEEALYTTLRSYLEQRMEKCREEINDFELKYSMSFEEFKDKLSKELELSWEHEKDFFFCEGAITDLKKHGRRFDSKTSSVV